MATSRKTVTTPKQWRAKKAKEPIELPSGNYAYLKRPGMERFLEAGFLPDSLATFIRKEIAQAAGKPDKKVGLSDMKMSEEDLDAYLSAMDRVCAFVMTEPVCKWHREVVYEEDGRTPTYDSKGHEVTRFIELEDRDEDALYTDELDQMDKNFIFQYAVGGSADLARFRATADSLMAAVSAGGAVEHTAESAAATD